MEVRLKLDHDEHKKWHTKFTQNANKLLGTPLPFQMRKQRMTDKGYNRFNEILNPNQGKFVILHMIYLIQKIT